MNNSIVRIALRVMAAGVFAYFVMIAVGPVRADVAFEDRCNEIVQYAVDNGTISEYDENLAKSDTGYAVYVYLCLINGVKHNKTIVEKAKQALIELTQRTETWGMPGYSEGEIDPQVAMLARGLYDGSKDVQNACRIMLSKLNTSILAEYLENPDPANSNLQALFNHPDGMVRALVVKNLIRHKPNRTLSFYLNDYVEKLSVSREMKMNLLDLYEGYGVETNFSFWQVKNRFACDPDPVIRKRARELLKSVEVLPPDCVRESPIQRKEEPCIRAGEEPSGYLGYVSMRVEVENLKSNTEYVRLFVKYPPDTVKAIESYYRSEEYQRIGNDVICFERSAHDGGEYQEQIRMGLKAIMRRDRTFDGTGRSTPVTLKVWASGVTDKKKSYPIKWLGGDLVFEPLGEVWEKQGESLTEKVKAEFAGKTGKEWSINNEEGLEPRLFEIPANKGSVLVLNIAGGCGACGFKGGVWAYEYADGKPVELLNVFNDSEEVVCSVLDWNDEKILCIDKAEVVEETEDSDGPQLTRDITKWFRYRGGKMKEVYSYTSVIGGYHIGYTYLANFVSEGGKFYRHAEESGLSFPDPDNLLIDARRRKAEIVWDDEKERFVEGKLVFY